MAATTWAQILRLRLRMTLSFWRAGTACHPIVVLTRRFWRVGTARHPIRDPVGHAQPTKNPSVGRGNYFNAPLA
jgi:hypothetical protein